MCPSYPEISKINRKMWNQIVTELEQKKNCNRIGTNKIYRVLFGFFNTDPKPKITEPKPNQIS